MADVSAEPSPAGLTSVDAGQPVGLVVDWGGVLTASLDGAMTQWARIDAVEYDHFRDVMRAWVGRPDAASDPDLTAGRAAPGRKVPDQPVAGLEQAEDSGPAGLSPVHRLERGEMAPADFERVLAEELARRGSPVPAEGLLRRMLGGLEKLDDDMINVVRRAHAFGVKTALLSNSWGNHYPEELWEGAFDAVVISGRVGMRKPEPEIFRHAVHLLDLPPEQC